MSFFAPYLRLMPAALNLGTPKLPCNTSVGTPPSSLPNSKLKPTAMSSSPAGFMADMLTTYPPPQPAALSAFHSASLQPASYMAPPPPAAKGPSVVPSTSIAKPMPISMATKVPVTKVVSGGMEKDPPQPAFSSVGGGGKVSKPGSKMLSSESVSVKEEGLLNQGYYPTPPVLNSPSNSLSKMLMAPSSPSQEPQTQEQQQQQQQQQALADSSTGVCVRVRVCV